MVGVTPQATMQNAGLKHQWTVNLVFHFHISHVWVAVNSQRVEFDGFKRLVDRLQECGIRIGSITTDRHKQIRSYMRKFLKHILHQVDVWHIGNNIKKKPVKLAKKKSCHSINGLKL